MNLIDNNKDTNKLMGRKMNLIVLNEAGKKEDIGLGSIEIKKEDVTDESRNIQLNKNICIYKSILKRLNNFIGNDDNISTFKVVGFDIRGVNAFTYIIRPFESIITAFKTCNNPMFLPMDNDNLSEFIYGSSLDQLLNYQKHIITLNRQLNQASKKYKRLRATQKYVRSNHSPRSPLRSAAQIPVGTFYSPTK